MLLRVGDDLYKVKQSMSAQHTKSYVEIVDFYNRIYPHGRSGGARRLLRIFRRAFDLTSCQRGEPVVENLETELDEIWESERATGAVDDGVAEALMAANESGGTGGSEEGEVTSSQGGQLSCDPTADPLCSPWDTSADRLSPRGRSSSVLSITGDAGAYSKQTSAISVPTASAKDPAPALLDVKPLGNKAKKPSASAPTDSGRKTVGESGTSQSTELTLSQSEEGGRASDQPEVQTAAQKENKADVGSAESSRGRSKRKRGADPATAPPGPTAVVPSNKRAGRVTRNATTSSVNSDVDVEVGKESPSEEEDASNDPEEKKAQESDPDGSGQTLYCICGTVESEERYIACSAAKNSSDPCPCNGWVHVLCVGLDSLSDEALETMTDYKCPPCTLRLHRPLAAVTAPAPVAAPRGRPPGVSSKGKRPPSPSKSARAVETVVAPSKPVRPRREAAAVAFSKDGKKVNVAKETSRPQRKAKQS